MQSELTGQTPTTSTQAHARHSLKARIVSELQRFVVLFLYLWVLLGLFVLNQDMTLRTHGFSVTAQGVALVNALVLAKIMLIADDLHFGYRLQKYPLAVAILCDAGLFSLLFIVCHALEDIVIGLFKGKSVVASIPTFGGGGLAGVICVALIMFVALVPFFGFRHLGRVIGEARLNALLFGPAARYPEQA